MRKFKDKIRREVEDALRETGRSWDIVETGSMHRMVYLEGKKIATICICPGPRRDAKQILAKIRGRMKEIEKQEKQPCK